MCISRMHVPTSFPPSQQEQPAPAVWPKMRPAVAQPCSLAWAFPSQACPVDLRQCQENILMAPDFLAVQLVQPDLSPLSPSGCYLEKHPGHVDRQVGIVHRSGGASLPDPRTSLPNMWHSVDVDVGHAFIHVDSCSFKSLSALFFCTAGAGVIPREAPCSLNVFGKCSQHVKRSEEIEESI